MTMMQPSQSGLPDLHRPVDTQDFVFTERKALPTRALAPPPGEHFSTDAYHNSSQSGIQRKIVRRVTGAKAIAVEYSLPRLGRTIIAPLRGMCRWSKRYHKKVSAEVHLPEAYEMQ